MDKLSRPIQTDLVTDYLANVWTQVDGWLTLVSVWMVTILLDVQKSSGLVGNAVEIGCWEGRTLLLLQRLLSEREFVIGYDLVLREQLRENNDNFKCDGRANVSLEEIDSRELDSARIRQDSEIGIRFFHVDGYHTREVARNDLALAFESTMQGGIIALDDFFSISVPGVSEAYFDLVSESGTNGFLPFAIGGGKLFLSTAEHRPVYKNALIAGMPVSSLNAADVSVISGQEVAIYELGPNR